MTLSRPIQRSSLPFTRLRSSARNGVVGFECVFEAAGLRWQRLADHVFGRAGDSRIGPAGQGW